MVRRVGWVAVAAFAAVLAIVSAAAARPSAQAAATASCTNGVSIGMQAPITGPAGSIGADQLHWAEFFFTQWNNQHKLKIHLVQEDTQLDPSKAKPGAVDPWPAAEPGTQVGGSGSPGTVHVVANVRGAEVWLLAGLGPEARIEQLACNGDVDVLLAGPQPLSPRKRVHVSGSDIQNAPADPQGNKVITASAK